jgi:hypothetical protein
MRRKARSGSPGHVPGWRLREPISTGPFHSRAARRGVVQGMAHSVPSRDSCVANDQPFSVLACSVSDEMVACLHLPRFTFTINERDADDDVRTRKTEIPAACAGWVGCRSSRRIEWCRACIVANEKTCTTREQVAVAAMNCMRTNVNVVMPSVVVYSFIRSLHRR